MLNNLKKETDGQLTPTSVVQKVAVQAHRLWTEQGVLGDDTRFLIRLRNI